MPNEGPVAQAIRTQLAALAPTRIELRDDSARHAGHAGARDDGGHFELLIVSAAFAGRRTIERHRMVYDALGPLMRREIHALSITALSEEAEAGRR